MNYHYYPLKERTQHGNPKGVLEQWLLTLAQPDQISNIGFAFPRNSLSTAWSTNNYIIVSKYCDVMG
jgi:hypothetical protein